MSGLKYRSRPCCKTRGCLPPMHTCLPKSVTLPCSHPGSSCSFDNALWRCVAGNEGDASSPSALQRKQQPDSQQEKPSVKSAAARKTLSYKEAFWLATMGGAHALGLQVRFCCMPRLHMQLRGFLPSGIHLPGHFGDCDHSHSSSDRVSLGAVYVDVTFLTLSYILDVLTSDPADS